MYNVNSFHSGLMASGYCCQPREPISVAMIQTIEKGVQLIEKILAKEILCRHDVEQINQTYIAIDLLERQIDPIPEPNSKHILQRIVEKVDTIAKTKPIPAQAWIYLYHLRRFSHLKVNLKEDFKTLWDKATEEGDPILKRELAIHLPYCKTEKQFDKDVKALIGPSPSLEITAIIDQKKEALRHHEGFEAAIVEKKQDLEKQRQINPLLYPPYLDELLDGGCIHLYTHLTEMSQLADRNKRRSVIEETSFSSVSHIVLETREAIIRKVERAIPKDYQNILFLLGGSGAGKSTTLCFLRGDQMILNNFQYKSADDRDQIIGDASAISCTFLPTVENLNHWIIVDFPGFDDSNGPLVSMGMEFALKALIGKYNPQILVVESITNIEGRFANAAKLGVRLARLIENKQECLLGITKYSRDPDYGLLKTIEEKQKQDLCIPSVEEQVLEGKIQTLVALNMPALQTNIDELQQKLNAIRKQKEEEQRLPLPETPEKQKARNQLREREEELLKQIGLGDVIRFDTLDDPNLLSNCFKQLTEKNKLAQSHSQQVLDPEHRELIENRFEKNLQIQIENQKEFTNLKDFHEFEQNILETSLIHTMFRQTNPEIGSFLHAPEMDPRLVRKFDQAIVGNCIHKCIRLTVANLNMALIQKILTELKDNRSHGSSLKQLEKKSEQLRNYILGLLGSLPEDPKKANEAWHRIQEDQKLAIDEIEKGYALPTWASVLLGLPLGVPLGIRTLYKWNQQTQKSVEIISDLLKDLCDELQRIHETLIKLKDIEKIIHKQEQIEEAFHSVPISLEFELKTLEHKISAVRKAYGDKDWDERVEFLQQELDFYPTYKEMIVPLMDDEIIYYDQNQALLRMIERRELGLPGIYIISEDFYTENVRLLSYKKNKELLDKIILIEKESIEKESGYKIEKVRYKRIANKTAISNFSLFVLRLKEFTEGKMNMKNSLFRTMVSDALFKKLKASKGDKS